LRTPRCRRVSQEGSERAWSRRGGLARTFHRLGKRACGAGRRC
jgi:hypothetical protein